MEIVTELVAGRLGYSFVDAQTALPFVEGGQLRVIAVGGTERSRLFPDAPTLRELGLEGFEPGSWFGLFAPRGTPDDVVAKISGDLREAVESAEISEWLRSTGSEPAPLTAEDFLDFIGTQTVGWASLAENVGLSVKKPVRN